MIKKLSLFFSAIAIGILSIFGSISTKNAAEPQYFLKNTQVKNAFVDTSANGINEYIIYFDPEVNNYEEYNYGAIFTINNNSQAYYVLNETNNFVDAELSETIIGFFGEFYNDLELQFYAGASANQFSLSSVLGDDSIILLSKNSTNNQWNLYSDSLGYINNIIAIKFINVNLTDSLDNINSDLEPYIGNLTALPTEPIPPLEQINTLVSDIVNWFTSIFNGLGNVFYDPTANKLTAWGTVMFIGVAIMLISMALKWVISLIRGV